MEDIQLNFNISLFVVIFFVTLLPFFWIRKEDAKGKIFFLLIIFFIFLYSGIGGSLQEANHEYVIYYAAYCFVLGLTMKVSKIKFNFTKQNDIIFSKYINKRGEIIIISYTFLGILSLIFPEVIIGRLISPPAPDVVQSLNMRIINKDPGIIANIVDLLQTLLLPFYYWALRKYKSIIKVAIIMFFNIYVAFCHNSYIGRHEIVMALIILLMVYLSTLTRKKRIMVITGVSFSIPFLCYILFKYSMLRLGVTNVSISTFDAMEILFGQEITYPLLYDSYKDIRDPSLIVTYFEWLLFLPLPSFLKFGFGQGPADIFTELVLGLSRGENGFYVILPGIVGEAIFYFGHYLFFIHAIILGLIIKTTYLSLRESKSLAYVFYFYAITFSFILSRGGTLSVYPTFFKHFLILSIFLIHIKNKAGYKR